VMRQATDDRHGWRLRALIVVLWRGGLRIQEALALAERDLDPRRGSLLVRNGKGGRRREIGMDAWGWDQLQPWLAARIELPVGALFCIIDGPTRGLPWSSAGVLVEFRRLAAEAGVRRRFAPHQLRHAHAVELARGRAAERDPAPARSHQPRHDLDLPPRDRHRGDHRDRPRPARPNDVGDRRSAPVASRPPQAAGALRALPLAMDKRAGRRCRSIASTRSRLVRSDSETGDRAS
jgi:integrase